MTVRLSKFGWSMLDLVPWTKSVSGGQNQCAILTKRKSICNMFQDKNIISRQQVARKKKLASKMFHKQKSVSWGEKPMYIFYKEKNQHATNFTNKKQHAAGSTNKNPHVTSSGTKSASRGEKINVKISRKEKINTQQVLCTKKSTRSKFLEQKISMQ